MPKRISMLLLSVFVAVSLIPLPAEGTNHLLKKDKLKEPDEATKIQVAEGYGKLPLHFEANHGQVDGSVRFLSRGNGYQLFLTSTEAVLSLRRPDTKDTTNQAHTLRMKWEGANHDPKVEGVDELEGKSNYFVGNEPNKWRTNISLYQKVKYRDVYPGIDFVYYGNQRQLEYDLVIEPKGDLSAVRLSIEGADKLTIDERGNLILSVGGGQVIQHKPLIYQDIGGKRNFISGEYVIKSPEGSKDSGKVLISFKLGPFDAKNPIIIDPVLSYSTYLGGGDVDRANAIAVDISGNAYVTGRTSSVNFPLSNPIQGALGGGYDVFVTKLNPSGSAPVYSTYLGGSEEDIGYSIALDDSGNAYITGSTSSANFPCLNPIQPVNAGGDDAFLTKINPSGSALVYSTYIGGSGSDFGKGIAVDGSGSAYVTGVTSSTNFPTVNPIQGSNAGGVDAFVTKINPSGFAVVYSTYLGGSGGDFGHSIAVDISGSAHITGETTSNNFPTVNPIQAMNAGYSDAFVTKLNPSGSAFVYSTYLGGSGSGWTKGCFFCSSGTDRGVGIAVDSSGNAYVTGQTGSSNFPVVNPLQTYGGNFDAFITKLDSSGVIIYSTFFGANGADLPWGVAVDSSGSAYITGYTVCSMPILCASNNFPIINPIQGTPGGGSDAFLSIVNPSGSALLYSDFIGGSGDDTGYGIAVDSSGNAYIAGGTSSANFPTLNPIQGTNAGGEDVFVTKLNTNIASETVSTPNTPTGVNSGTAGILYSYTTGGSTSSFGHPVEYQFDWKRDGSDLSPWGAATQTKIWPNAAPTSTYNVRARARCTAHTFIVSSWSGTLVVVVAGIETISTPSTLSGPVTGVTGVSYAYTTGGSISNFSHPVEYQFDWKGDGSDLSPWDSATQSKTWTIAGTYNVRSRARSTGDTSAVSGWFAGLSVTIFVGTETVSTPNTPSGPTSGTTNISYSYSTGGSISSLGHPVEYQFDWKGDGSKLSPWGSPTQSKTWTAPGTYNVQARGRCTIDNSVISNWSIVLTVTITYGGKGVINLPWTGQSKCYDLSGVEISCDGTGQDGELQEGVGWPNPRFTVNGDCVTDNLTGLMWSRNANLPNGTRTWQGALDYVASINTGSGICGYKDWCLPNVNELETLINMGETDPALWLNNQGFLNVQHEYYWSSTGFMAPDRNDPWKVHMNAGSIRGGGDPVTNFVWPVRAGQMDNPDPLYPANVWKTGQTMSYASGDDGDLERGVSWPIPRFSDHGDGTVTDKLTGLMWSKDTDLPNDVLLWQEALDFVKSINSGAGLGGYHDWRLPNAKELMSLDDRSKSNPVLPAGHPFQNVRAYWYWSSSTYAPMPYQGWAFFMVDGEPVPRVKFVGQYYVWLVRSPQGASSRKVPADFDGDGKTDITIWRPENGFWYTINSSNGSNTYTQWGGEGDIPVPGDYDGDGKTDIAVWRPSRCYWYIIRSSDGVVTYTLWGAAGDVPLTGDFDGDGKADIVIWRPSNGYWYIINSSDQSVDYVQWGGEGDIPVSGDFDGDGKADIAIWKPSNGSWYIIRSSDQGLVQVPWGGAGDVPISGDFDGDGRADIAVWRPSNGYWYIINSFDQSVDYVQWGGEGDIPVPGDYDGDGKTDIAVYRPSNGYWYIIRTSDQSVVYVQWGGMLNDMPISQ